MAKDITDKNFDEEVTSFDGIVLVDFWAPWCGPCQMLGPIVEEVGEEFKAYKKVKFVKVNVDENPGASQKYGIMNIPALKFFKGGEIVDELIGVRPKEEIVEKINQLSKE